MADFTPDAMFPSEATVSITRKGGAAVDVTTRVANFTEGGGTKDIEKVDYFGGAQITVKKTQDPLEVSFETVVKDTDWAYVFTGSQTTSGSAIKITSDGTQTDYKIKLEWLEATGSAAYKLIYYDVVGVTYEKDWAADGYLKATINFKLTATDSAGSGQRYEIECYDLNDSTGSGSYVSWESSADTLFGY